MLHGTNTRAMSGEGSAVEEEACLEITLAWLTQSDTDTYRSLVRTSRNSGRTLASHTRQAI